MKPIAAVAVVVGALSCLACSYSSAEPVMAKVSIETLFSDLTAERDIETRKGVSYGARDRHKLDVYEPSPPSQLGPIVIFYYGGGWTTGDRSFYGFVGSAFAKRGYTTIIPDYRLFPEVAFPDFVTDAALAYAWVAQNVANAATARRPIFIVGHSAGAHIAALLALDEQYLGAVLLSNALRPAGLIGLSGPYAFDPTTWKTTRDIFKSAARQPDQVRPVALVTSHAPPTLLIHGQDDDVVTVDAARQLYQSLIAKGIDATKIEYPGVGHVGLVLTLARPLRWRADALDQTIAFIAKHSSLARSEHRKVQQRDAAE